MVNEGGLTVRVAVSVIAPSTPVIVAIAAVATGRVVILTVAEELPAATVTEAGIVAFA